MSHLRDRPEINKYSLQKKREPFEKRANKTQDIDRILKRARIAKENESDDQCTFTPNIGESSELKRSRQDLEDWGRAKYFRMVSKQLERNDLEGASFIPKINQKSKRIVGIRSGSTHDRLYLEAEEIANKRTNLLKSKNKALFKPRMGGSKSPLRKNKSLIGAKTGESRNVDYFNAKEKTDEFKKYTSEDPKKLNFKGNAEEMNRFSHAKETNTSPRKSNYGA